VDGSKHEIPVDTSVDISEEIADLFDILVSVEAQLYSIAAAGNNSLPVVNLFIAKFLPAWIAFYRITKLGFDQEYMEKEQFTTLMTKAETDIKKYRNSKPDINDVWRIIDTFDEYAPHIVDKSMLTITG
jgi:hypothetical protein